MARTAHVTHEEIAAIADTLLAAGLKPTSREIRARLGTGSMGTILKGLQAWKANQVSETAELNMPEALQAALFECLAQERAKVRVTFEQHLADQKIELDVLANENERLSTEIASLNAFVENLQTMAAVSRERSRQLENELLEARLDAEGHRSEADSLRLEAAKATLRTETIPALEAECQRIRQRLEDEANARVAAEREVAVLIERCRSLELRT